MASRKLEDTLYEIEQILFSADDEVLTMAIMEHYPHGYPTERPIPVPPPSPPHNEERKSCTLHRYSRWQIEIWYRHFERLALSAPLPLAVPHSFVRDVILDEIYNRDRILAAAEDRAWVQEMPREADGWDMLVAYGLPQVPLPELGGWVQE
ncbi:hypothetical protein R1sor_015022 [Riccia sorocarpa]|uniref:Uncharacterized protein n=1 Tax=Riccia sorocarpa TaxID=122646 RepID=A0ABD3HB16_9MARC